MTDLDDLRYPIGRFAPPASSLPGIAPRKIHTLQMLPERLRAAVAGLNRNSSTHPTGKAAGRLSK